MAKATSKTTSRKAKVKKKKTTARSTKASKKVAKQSATKKTTAKPAVDRRAEVDAYIEKAPAFAQPIMKKIRAAHRKASKNLVETIKWGVPHFDYNGIVSGTAAFKKHVSFGFWKSKLMSDPKGLFKKDPRASMCHMKFESVDELPDEKVLVAYIKEAMALNEADQVASQSDARAKKKKKTTAKALPVPPDLMAELKKPANKKARSTFENFPPGKKKEYTDWLIEAKREETRARRLATTIEWLNEGKSRHWKYQNC